MAPRTVVQDLVAGEVSTEVYSVRWNNDDTLLAAGHGDGTVRIYSAADGRFLRRLNCRISPEQLPVTSVRWRPGVREELNNVLLCATANGAIMHWLPEEGRELNRIVLPDNQCLCSDFNPDGSTFAVGCKDSFIRVYDEETFKPIFELANSLGERKGHSSRVFSVKWTDENTLISGGWDNSILIWDLRNRAAIRTIVGPHICGDALDWNGHYIASASFAMEEQLQIWDLHTGRKMRGQTLQFGQRPCMAYAVQFSKIDAGFTVAAGGTDECHFLESDTLTRFHVISPIPKAVYSLDHANHSNRLAVGCGDGTIQLLHTARVD